jgi:hypothetical protein
MSRLTDVFTLFSGFLVVFGPKEVTMALPAAIHQSLLTGKWIFELLTVAFASRTKVLEQLSMQNTQCMVY